jgi:hypothetical protein
VQRRRFRFSQQDFAQPPTRRTQSVNFDYLYSGIEKYPASGIGFSLQIT